MKMKYSLIPDKVKEAYQLDKIVSDYGFVYIQIGKGMYGLLQAATLEKKLLVKRLNSCMYRQSKKSMPIDA